MFVKFPATGVLATLGVYTGIYYFVMTFLERVCGALRDAGARYAVVGGYGVALHGAVRGTIDVDVVLRWTLGDLSRAEEALNGIGLTSRLPVAAEDVYNFRDEYVENRRLVAWNFYNPGDPLEQVDIIITYDLKSKRTKRMELGAGAVEVLSIEDLIEMKKQSGRAQDMEDVAALERIG